ncbi:hypothetical protein ELQ87_25410 [Streptomyces griseoviridis]|uniref:MarR family transcriptional regulator n=1 Tax=Streptomyces griseoviridis TaxID=45398 RepID=A0A3S9ZHB2_STRGD|nr:hypothetical protein [Streptomyces griseoviridis]AZS87206.1 hypothetical protein ELQ87_25410 [Streptomyces griseoviridis]QCN85940.1 hypothetical protein DDJ31_13865 [Streptomyces griseoviridis]
MPPQPAPTLTRRAVTQLDHRIEAATGHEIDILWTYRDRGALDEPHAQLVDRHRTLSNAQTGVTFYLKLLNRLTSGEFPVDGALFVRIDRTVEQLEEATSTRDAAAQKVLAALEPIETAAATTSDGPPLSADDQAVMLAIAGGAKLHEHLLTGRAAVTASSGARIPYPQMQKLERAGLIVRDTSHPVHAGQPVSLTDAGRAALLDARRTRSTHALARPGAWPSTPAKRR